MIKLKTLLEEQDSSGTFKMYHGGKRWSRIPNELIGSSKGRYEGGPGIYFTNSYETARKYAKGPKVVHLVDISRNYKDIKDIEVPLQELIDFVKNVSQLRKKSEIINSLRNNAERMQRNVISLDILNNLIVNFEAGAGKAGVAIANYFASKGGDAKLESKSGEEEWLIVFNPNIIKSVSVLNPKTVNSDFPFMLNKKYLYQEPQRDYTAKLANFVLQQNFPTIYNLCTKKIIRDTTDKTNGIEFRCKILDNDSNDNTRNEWLFIYNVSSTVLYNNILSISSEINIFRLKYYKKNNELIDNRRILDVNDYFFPTGNHMEDEHELEQLFLHPFNSKILSLLSDNKFQEILKYLHAK